jgi:queuine tRNA-ribosyltransferase
MKSLILAMTAELSNDLVSVFGNSSHMKKIKNISSKNKKIKLPLFMPDATRGVLKLLSNNDIVASGTEAMVVNTFHLFLRPGMKIIKKAGGIHKFMDYNGFLISDSGGFQVFSLIHRNPGMGKISDKEVIFKSPVDGSKHSLSPEKSIQIQFDLGTNAVICLDDCPPNDYDREAIKKAVDRTVKWALRCKKEYEKQVKKRKLSKDKRPLLFSVIQGGAEIDLRKKCAEELIKIGFDGYGFGARPVDKNGKFLGQVLKYTADLIPADKYKFALGIGTPEDILRCFSFGWELFDCVIPTREGRHGKLFFFKDFQKPLSLKNLKFYKTININNRKFSLDLSPINKNSKIKELRQYSKAYLNHLFKIKEPLGAKLAGLNNLEFYNDLIRKIRAGLD